MRKNLAVLLAGALIGGLLFMAYPTPAATTSKRLKRLENKVETLQKKTRFMTRRGFYNSFVYGNQVLGFCDEGVTATWFDRVGDTTVLDDCFTGSMSERNSATGSAKDRRARHAIHVAEPRRSAMGRRGR
jgi:hypothetical protein